MTTLVTFLVENEPWKEQAACRGEDPNIFFPGRGQSHKYAHAVCATCPVTVECDEYAKRTNSNYGIWGGNVRER